MKSRDEKSQKDKKIKIKKQKKYILNFWDGYKILYSMIYKFLGLKSNFVKAMGTDYLVGYLNLRYYYDRNKISRF